MAETHLTAESAAPANGFPELARLNGAVTPEVDEFCRKHDLFDALAVCLRLAEQHLQPSGPPDLEVHVDPEWGDSWLIVRASLHGTVDEVVAAQEKCLRAWIAAVSIDSLAKITLSCRVAEQ